LQIEKIKMKEISDFDAILWHRLVRTLI
jgi:hypothetical protein